MTTLTSKCHCGSVEVTAKVPKDQAPADLHLCMCDMCRYTTGGLCNPVMLLPEDGVSVKGETGAYSTSEGTFRRFCKKCGATVYTETPKGDPMKVCSGLVRDADQIGDPPASIVFVSSTKDGGIRNWLLDVQAFREGPGDGPIERGSWFGAPVKETSGHIPAPKSTLKCSCYCGDVKFEIKPPNETNFSEDKDVDASGLKEFADRNSQKYSATLCFCESCRLTSGLEFVPWVFVPERALVNPDGTPFKVENSKLKVYKSSDKVSRYFCPHCGAKTYFRTTERPGRADVNVGLLRSLNGARADDWLEWIDPDYTDEARKKQLTDQLKNGYKRYNMEVYAADRATE